MSDKDTRAGKRQVSPELLDYLDRVHAGHDAGLDAAFAAPDREDIPSIMVSQTEGRLLELLIRLVGARRVVEVGTLAGYSAIRMARALPPDGHLWTLEYEPRHAEVARRNVERAGLADRVTVRVGDARQLLPTLETHGPFDAVFVDADKESYDHYGAWAATHLRSGGLLLGDNANLFGNLLDDTPAAAAMRRFHEQTAAAFHSVCIPTPDGLVLAIKK